MIRIFTGNRLSLYLLLGCVLLAGIIAIEISRAPHLDIDALLQTPSVPVDEVRISRAEYSPPPLSAFDEILSRPLFSENRQPPPPPQQAAATPVPVVAHIRLELEGIAITPEARIAVLRDLTTKKVLHLAEGSNHNGWKLDSVNTDSALFKRNQQTLELELKPDEATPGQKPRDTTAQKIQTINAAEKQ